MSRMPLVNATPGTMGMTAPIIMWEISVPTPAYAIPWCARMHTTDTRAAPVMLAMIRDKCLDEKCRIYT